MSGEKNIVRRVTPALFPNDGKRGSEWARRLGALLMLACSTIGTSAAEVRNRRVEMVCAASSGMIQLAGALAMAYHQIRRDVFVSIAGDGDGKFRSILFADFFFSERALTAENHAELCQRGLR